MRFDVALARNFHPNRHAVRVDAPHRVVVFEVSWLTCKAASQCVEFGPRRYTPRHFTQRRTLFEGGRQRRIVRIHGQNRAAVQRFEAGAGFVVRSLFQTPVGEKASAGFEVRHTVGNLFNAENRHVVPLVSQFVWGALAHAKGASFKPQYRLFCCIYSRMPRRPFSRPIPLSFQPENGVEIENSL